MHLIHKPTGKPVKVGDVLRSFRGEDWTVTGWQEPKNINSTGRVCVARGEWNQSFYPSVFSCEWRDQA